MANLLTLNRDKVRHVLGAVDWGFTNPGVLGIWIEDNDGRLYRIHEVYQTKQLIDWWIERALEFHRHYNVEAFICDPSEPAYIEQFNRAGLRAIKAVNDIGPGVQAVATRLQKADDGKPRLFLCRDALAERDMARVEKNLPTCTEDEFPAYVWDTRQGRKRGEEPLKEHDHGMDMTRYMVAYSDLQHTAWAFY